ncbi:MAG: glycosyltransferase family 39 protein [Bacteroidia bacterium]|nr:glycosyltransferase family 39 protein [Bacteroidia bacterium]
MKKNIFKYITTDFRFWLIIFFVFRLYGITSPPLEVAHNWRQSTVSMVTRNFYETDSNILYPRVDMAGEKSGITGMEFPLLSYIAFLIAKLFGYSCWYERLINLIISSIGTYYFYLLIRKYFNERMALLAGLILICSLWLTYSRKIMPDTMSVSLVLIGLYYGIDFLLKGNLWRLLEVLRQDLFLTLYFPTFSEQLFLLL